MEKPIHHRHRRRHRRKLKVEGGQRPAKLPPPPLPPGVGGWGAAAAEIHLRYCGAPIGHQPSPSQRVAGPVGSTPGHAMRNDGRDGAGAVPGGVGAKQKQEQVEPHTFYRNHRRTQHLPPPEKIQSASPGTIRYGAMR